MKITKRKIEEIIIIGEYESDDFDQIPLLINGYKIIRSGPRPTGAYTYSDKEFEVIAQRVIDERVNETNSD